MRALLLAFMLAITAPAFAAELPAAGAGETVTVQAGIYEQRLVIATDNTTFRCVTPGACKIASTEGGSSGIVHISGNNSSVIGFDIDGLGEAQTGVDLVGPNSKLLDSSIRNINLSGGVGSAVGVGADGVVVARNTITNAGDDEYDHGIYIHNGGNWQVTDNIISGTSGFGVHGWGDIGPGIVSNNTVDGSGLGGITMGGGDGGGVAAGIVVSNNTVTGVGQYASIQEAGNVSGNTYTDNNVSNGISLKSGSESGTNGDGSGAGPMPAPSVPGPVVEPLPEPAPTTLAARVKKRRAEIDHRDEECKATMARYDAAEARQNGLTEEQVAAKNGSVERCSGLAAIRSEFELRFGKATQPECGAGATASEKAAFCFAGDISDSECAKLDFSSQCEPIEEITAVPDQQALAAQMGIVNE